MYGRAQHRRANLPRFIGMLRRSDIAVYDQRFQKCETCWGLRASPVGHPQPPAATHFGPGFGRIADATRCSTVVADLHGTSAVPAAADLGHLDPNGVDVLVIIGSVRSHCQPGHPLWVLLCSVSSEVSDASKR